MSQESTERIDVVENLEHVSPNQLITDGDNPNSQTDDEYESLKESIRNYGFFLPVITNRDYVVADGEHRLNAARELGISKIPVIALDVEDVDRRIIRQITNKLSGSHDIGEDAAEYERIREASGSNAWASYIAIEEREVTETVEHFLDTGDDDSDNANLPGDPGDGSDLSPGEKASDDPEKESETTPDSPGQQNSDEDAPDSFDVVDEESVDTEHECPNCGYEW